ncbi:hypothetical protein [Occallatibacter riparius]|uniref:Uncharacterized protein n=1 Tax=Occallatibacter riparius TaxID=1002689 RepID=A0A9J7BKF3_9BACT|nr:hypothetical protein [Occallatibacter riparius]UWZ81749.1 hypothetical protein MOP44_14260 [Occallatibacter riparius]
MDDIYIERLVLNIPGLSTENAKELAKQVGDGLAQTKPHAGDFGDLTVELNEQATSRNLPRLADEIVNSLLRQIG